MKTALLSGLAACVLFATAATSFAGHRYHRHGCDRGVRAYGNYGGYGYGYGGGFGSVNTPPGLYTAPPFQYGNNYGYGYGNGYGASYGGYGYGRPIGGHYHYQPGYAVPHGDHLDVIPGHYDYHSNGNFGPYYPR